jgi:flagellar hook-length control protein FliK
MSALPFLTALPPAPSPEPSGGALSPLRTPSSLASRSTDNTEQGPLLSDPMGAEQANTEEGVASFWETLQQQAASPDPSQGQTVSALSDAVGKDAPDIAAAVDEHQRITDLEETRNVTLQINEQAKLTQGSELAPWSMAAIQQAMQQTAQTKDYVANPAMEQIESQRIAQAQLQTNQGGVLNQYALQSETHLSAALAPTLAAEVPGSVIEGQMAQPAISKFVLANSKEALTTNGLVEESQLGSGFKLDESLLSKEPINLHEKPITLAPQEALAANPQGASVVQESGLPNMADALEGIVGGPQQAAKNLQTAAMTERSATQNADKVLAGQAKIDVPPSSPKFTEQIAQRINIMNGEQLQTARIQLDPPELGSLEIKLKVQQDQVSVSFTSGNQVVRDALESQAPRLKEMLEQQGVELTDVNVSDQQQQAAGGEQADGSGSGTVEDRAEDEITEETLVSNIQSDSLVDYYA